MRQTNKRSPARLFSLLAAACVAAALVGSLLFVFRLAHQSQGQNPPQIGSGGPQGIYASDYTRVFRLDPQTHQALWQREIKGVTTIIPTGNVVYILQSAMITGNTNAVLELDASDGKTRWTHMLPLQKGDTQEFAKDLVFAQGHLYVGWMGMQGNGRSTAYLDMLNASNGKQVTTYTVGSYLGEIAADNGVLAVSVESGLRVYDLASGQQLWQKPFAASTNAPATWLKVVNGLVYAVIIANDGQGPDRSTIRVYKVNSGEQVWQSPAFASDQLSSFTVDGNTVYFGISLIPHPPLDGQVTQKNKKPITGIVYAYDIQSNKKLWSAPVAGAALRPPVLNNGLLYIDVDSGVIDNPDPQPAQVVALNAATGHIQWKQTLGANYLIGFCVTNGTVYAGTYNVSRSGVTPIKAYALEASSGNIQWEDNTHDFITIAAG